ncbi:MAG: phosphodiester glycosidase family protein, partial [Paludibacter sp.]|nr:phosphodiester glycosidase family protein [Bacteroidales bacterium]MCM1069722.1 phosphodiester glycosidase family protein [Prevotella sp.]MCM1354370.1 phosphodiester glycosidase family protein [Bacteroides sp.]MCM1441917.1 phosphodiester glycosidase family protein [Muribaculum sp.]MCM1482568.1 phosphodiester glycosidase family protein [Paludibacter sp.]
MRKHYTCLIAALLLCINAATKADIMLGDVAYSLDTLESFRVGPGSTYTALQMKRISDAGGRLDAYILQVDQRNPYISFSQILGKDAVIGTERPSAMAERHTTDTHICFAGTNGDFFVTQGNVGTPIGLTIGDNQYAYIGSTSRRFGAVDTNNRPVLGTAWQYTGTLRTKDNALTIAHVNYERADNQLVLYNQHNGPTTLTNAFGTELLVELLEGETWNTNGTMQLQVVAKERNVGNMAIPAGAAVLSAHGAMADELDKIEVGEQLAVEFTLTVDGQLTSLSQAVGGDNYALIVNNGVPEKNNFWNENHPRTGFGASVTGDTVIFCVVDGRGSSLGCTTRVLGEIMHHYGAYKAVNWDGGGSSCMYLRQFGQVNRGADGSERAVANGMFAVADIPEADTEISEIQPYVPTLRLPRYGVNSPKFLGYNKYGILLDTDVRDVTLSCDESTGYIDAQGRFVCLGTGKLIAAFQNVRCEVEIQLAEDIPFTIRLDSVLVSDDTDYAIEV